MRGGRQTKHQQCRIRVAESRNRSTPVLLMAMRRLAFHGHQLAPRHQTRAGATGAYFRIEAGKLGNHFPMVASAGAHLEQGIR